MLALLAPFVTSCGAERADTTRIPSVPGDAGRAGAVRPCRPGRDELARLPPAQREAWCPAHADDTPRVVARLRTDEGDADTASQPFALAVMSDAGAGARRRPGRARPA